MLICPRANDCMFVGITLKFVATQHPEPRDDIEGLVIPYPDSPIAFGGGAGRAWKTRPGLTSEVYKRLKGRPRNTGNWPARILPPDNGFRLTASCFAINARKRELLSGITTEVSFHLLAENYQSFEAQLPLGVPLDHVRYPNSIEQMDTIA